MKLYHAIIACERDIGLADWHVANASRALEAIGQKDCQRCLYFGIPPDGRDRLQTEHDMSHATVDTHVVPFLDTYENLPLKTYGMLQHALTLPGWTHVLKADVNSYPSRLDAMAIVQHHLTGFYANTPPGRDNHVPKVLQRGLGEAYPGDLPNEWVGGPAYVISRLLVMQVVDRGAWYARGWPWEDVMVSKVAEECGCPARPGVGYWTDGNEWHNEHV